MTKLSRREKKFCDSKKKQDDGNRIVKFRCDFSSTLLEVMLARGWTQSIPKISAGICGGAIRAMCYGRSWMVIGKNCVLISAYRISATTMSSRVRTTCAVISNAIKRPLQGLEKWMRLVSAKPCL
ncbi:uncharacterized protein LOC115233119 [Formica exsecta]|uniref:uncharacterized protein LOC115233119 n=1 Tax=Formica exsecta TaxID=72781 RepID=UPI001143F97B|nr:uncharacterized protein LOC115233119 [Formica exsecta]